MQVYYMNDETDSVTVRVLHGVDALGNIIDEHHVLLPQQGKLFTVNCENPGQIPFLKRWDYRLILLTAVDPSLLP